MADSQNNDGESVQDILNSVNRRLFRPDFLRQLSTSQLPSQATSESSLSPGEPPPGASEASRDNAFRQDGLLSSTQRVNQATEYRDFAAEASDALEPQITDEVETGFIWAREQFAKMANEGTITTINHGHRDLVLAVDFDFYGIRMITAGADHKLKLWDRKDDTWVLTDTWKAHDAEITDVRCSYDTFKQRLILTETGQMEWTLQRPSHRQHRRRRSFQALARRRP